MSEKSDKLHAILAANGAKLGSSYNLGAWAVAGRDEIANMLYPGNPTPANTVPINMQTEGIDAPKPAEPSQAEPAAQTDVTTRADGVKLAKLDFRTEQAGATLRDQGVKLDNLDFNGNGVMYSPPHTPNVSKGGMER